MDCSLSCPDATTSSYDTLLGRGATVTPVSHHPLEWLQTTQAGVHDCFGEPFADGISSMDPLMSDGGGGLPVHANVRSVEVAHHHVPIYSEIQRDGQIQSTSVPPSTMRSCPSSASMVSCARSEADSSMTGPTCRICDSAGDNSNRLISPCRCSGTSKFVHEQCLNKWLETINARSAPRCEVCRYHIHTRKTYRLRNVQMPAVPTSDIILHVVFLFAFIILIVSATFTVIGFVSNHSKMTTRQPDDTLSSEDVVVLVGGLTFFIAFIVALLTQIRASQSLYRLCVGCIAANTEWRIDPYRRSDDSLYCN